MADDTVDISGMPDPGTIGLAQQDDPTSGMPDPKALFQQHHGYAPQSDEEVTEFMRNPDATPDVRKAKSARYGLSELSGLPRIAAVANPVTPVAAAVAGGAGALTGALGAALDPDNAAKHLETARDRMRRWSQGTYNLANYLPATGPGAELAEGVLGLPVAAAKSAEPLLNATIGENATQAVGDVAQDVGTMLPGLGVKGVVKTGAKYAGKAARAVKAVAASAEAPAGTTYDEAGNAQSASQPMEPDVGAPVSPESLRAQPNPIPPPEGTQAHARAAAAAPSTPSAVDRRRVLMPDGSTGYTLAAEGEVAKRAAMTDEELTAYDRANRLPAPKETKEEFQARLDAEADARGKTLGTREQAAAEAAAASSPGGTQRGSVRLFNSPAEEGPKETPAPEQQSERAQHLDAIDRLSGGLLPTRRTSALTGDYNATGDDYQAKEVGSESMRKQLASENAAMHAATEHVHASTGSEFENSVDSQTLGDRGRVTRGAIQGIEKHFDDATDGIYDAARAQNQGRPIESLKRVKAYLDDDSNFTNDAEIGLQRAAKQRLERLWTTGDPDKGTPPGSVNAAERFREFLNEKGKNPQAMGIASDLKGHVDMDVAEHGGPGLFETARAMRRHKYQMLEEPTGIKKLLTPGDSQGINHAIPEHKVMDYIADLPREQHEHVLNVLRAGAHLDPELAKSSAAAIREIQAHAISRMHAAATNAADGSWNARKFYNAADRYARNVPETFKDRPDIVANLQKINDAGNTLHMDKHYPGAGAQIERTSRLGHAIEAGGNVASSLVHDIPVVGRYVGRAIEGGVEGLGSKMSESNREKAIAKRLVDRNGKQRGSVQVAPEERENNASGESAASLEAQNRNREELAAGRTRHMIDPDGNVTPLTGVDAVDRAAPKGHVIYQKGAGVLDRGGLPQEQAAGLVNRARANGFDTEAKPPGGSQLNIGLHQGQEGQPGFRKMSKQEAAGAVESTGAKVTKSSVLTPDAHGVAEPTLVASTNRKLSEPEMQKVLAKTKQSAIPQRTDAGEESMHIAPGHEEIAKNEGWDKFNPEYFREHDGTVKPPSGQRGSFSFQNDNELNRATASPRAGQRGAGERNPRSEYNANDQLAGGRKLTDEQQRIIDKLAGNQRGSVRVMNEKPLAGAPEGDKPNGKARATAAAYAKKAGIDYKPLDEYKYVDPKVAKNVADAYEEMKHDPTNPKVKKSYDAFKSETLEQYKSMLKAGVKPELQTDYPYKNPREMHEDVRNNNHMSIYPTEAGFGSERAAPSDHPMLEKAPVKMGGKDATYNDLFRAVHDYYGHAAEGNGFRANGEYNAWRAHRQMYSDAARGAMDAETLGQNSWVNSGPAASFNKGASGADTIFADQKAGLLPKAVVKSAEEGVGADQHHITNQLTDQERNQLQSDTTKRLVDAFRSAPATKEYAAAALAGAAKRGWYRDSAQAIVNQFGHEAPRFAGLLSAMSPQVSVQTNFANALKTYINWDKAGRPEDPSEIRAIMEKSSQKSAKAAPGSSNVLDAWVNNAVRALTADDPSNIKLSGPKVHSFYNNLTDNVHEVTNDAWMASFAKIDPAKLGGSLNNSGPGKSPSYMALSAKVRDAARMISHLTGETWTPAEVQETVWSWAKTAYEHAEEKGSDVSIPDLVKNGDITDELIRSTPDFHQLFGTSEHRGLLQSSRFAGNAEGVADRQKQGPDTTRSGEARAAAQQALRPHLISAAERLEQVRQERRAAGKDKE